MGYTFYFFKLQGNSLKVLVKVIGAYWADGQEYVLFLSKYSCIHRNATPNYRNATILLRNATPFFVFFSLNLSTKPID